MALEQTCKGLVFFRAERGEREAALSFVCFGHLNNKKEKKRKSIFGLKRESVERDRKRLRVWGLF